MAGFLMGNFGGYKYEYFKQKLLEEKELASRLQADRDWPSPEDEPEEEEEDIVWVAKAYCPNDPRHLVPKSPRKLITPRELPTPRPWWLPPRTPSLKSFSRGGEELGIYPSTQRTRCEDWSTLREMLPSKGPVVPVKPNIWGRGGDILPPIYSPRKLEKYPHINSPMTQFVDSASIKDHNFRLY